MSNWKTSRTLLIVGEGETEVAFLNHVKGIYAPRGCGLKVTIKNAHGKGARHVVEMAARHSRAADYDTVAVLLDTDQDWSDAVAKKARDLKIRVLKSEPFFEAVLLRLIGESDNGDSKALKTRLAPFVGNNSLVSKNYAMRFDRYCLESRRTSEKMIEELLDLFS